MFKSGRQRSPPKQQYSTKGSKRRLRQIEAQADETSLNSFLRWLGFYFNRDVSPSSMSIVITGSTAFISIVFPDLAVIFSRTLYLLWSIWTIGPSYSILSRPTPILLDALFVKLVMAILMLIDESINIGSIAGSGWYFLVPCVLSARTGKGYTIGQAAGGYVGRVLYPVPLFPPIEFPPLEGGGLDFMLAQVVGGLHESLHSVGRSIQIQTPPELIWMVCIGFLAGLQYAGYNASTFVLYIIQTFKIWYTLRLFVPPPVPSRLTVESKLIPNLYSFWVLNEIGTMIACIPAITRVLERTEVSSRIITMLGVLILTCSYPNQGLGVSQRIVQKSISLFTTDPTARKR